MRIAIATAAACLCVIGFTATAQVQAAVRKHTEIPAESLDLALRALAKERGFQLIFLTENVATLQTHGAVGEFTIDEALKKLLSDSHLEYKFVDENTVSIFPKVNSSSMLDDKDSSNASLRSEDTSVGSAASSSEASFRLAQVDKNAVGPQVAGDETSKIQEPLSEIVVTGTHIRGGNPVGSALKTYDRTEILESGASTIDQFARDMTENFAGVDSIANATSNASLGRFSAGTADNSFSGASFNLHGLGTTSTLTLLNGHRLAPAGQGGLLTDVSQIPLSAIDHIEVLTDGASAVYGADAVAGVVNIITRKDFDGAETGLRYGSSTSGGDDEYTGSQLLGKTWNTGSALLTYEFNKQNGLDADQRSYILNQGGPYALLPANKRNSVFASGSQDLWSGASLSGDAMYSNREFNSSMTTVSTGLDLSAENLYSGHAAQSAFSLTLDNKLPRNWRADLTANYSRVSQTQDIVGAESIDGSAFTYTTLLNTTTSITELGASADGSTISLPGGMAKVALGANFRTEQFDTSSELSFFGVPSPGSPQPDLQRHITSVYGELFVPLVGSANSIPWVRRLEFSGAVRYDHYSDFGSTTNPRFGLMWEPMEALQVHSSYGTSFRAPPLSQLGTQVNYNTAPETNPNSPSGTTDTLFISGGNPALHAETSKSITAGLDFKPLAIPSLSIAMNYFHVRFDNRIETPLGVAPFTFSDPTLAPFISFNPTLAQVESYFSSPGFQNDGAGQGPAGVQAIFNNQVANIAATRQSGIDLSATYGLRTTHGDISLVEDVTRMLVNSFQTTPTAPFFTLLNTFAEPTKWKARSGVGWKLGGFNAKATLNYVNSYNNDQFTPSVPIASSTTIDLYAAYETGKVDSSNILSGLTVALSVQNLANRQPPYAIPVVLPGQNPIPFDPTNASPVGRFVALSVTKRW